MALDTHIDFQRSKVLDERRSKLFSPAEQAAFQPLVEMAVEHIDRLKNQQGMKALPWPVAVFGRAYVTKNKRPIIDYGRTDALLAPPGWKS